MRFFPAISLQAVVSLYAFFRTLDDLVDEHGQDWRADDVRQELHAWHEWLNCGSCSTAPREPLGTIMASLLDEYQIPTSLFHDFLDGLLTDVEPRACPRFR